MCVSVEDWMLNTHALLTVCKAGISNFFEPADTLRILIQCSGHCHTMVAMDYLQSHSEEPGIGIAAAAKTTLKNTLCSH